VTISGNLDFAAAQTGGTQAASKGTTVTTGAGTSSTSVIRFIAVEDLGGGLKATANYALDPRSLANDSLSVTNNTAATSTTGAVAAAATGLARDEVFVGLSGDFGNIRLGSPNSIGLNAWQPSSALGTGIGSGYTGGGVSGTVTNSFVQTRYSRSVRFDSPVMAGFQVAVLYAPGNDEAAVTASSGGLTAQRIPNARKATEIGLRYSNGPLTVAYANVAQAAQTNATGYFSTTTAVNAAKTAANILSASYTIDATTLHLGMNNGNRLAAGTGGVAVDSKGSSVGITHNIGAVGLMASYRTQKVGTVEAKVTGLRADYNLSKTSAVYAGYEKFDNGAAAANETTLVAVGVRKSF
jgi:predicted porin